MYNFVDVTEVSEGAFLPSEALRINGAYIEDIVPGYRTLWVTGREALSPEISTLETGTRDGSAMKSKRYPARKIRVGYQLITESPEAFRTAYNKLAQVLDVDNAELIFNDEADKFFTGTPCAVGDVEHGRCSVTSEFEIICVDPFKYSVEEKEVSPSSLGSDVVVGKVFEIDYGGTYKSFPKLEASFYDEEEANGDTTKELTGNGDCGFVAFICDGKIVQLGDEDESDAGDTGVISQTLVAQNFNKATSWGSAAKSYWATNSNTVTVDAVERIGTMAMKQTAEGEYYLTPSNYGAATGLHGASVTRVIPADANGDTGAANFTMMYSHKIGIGSGGVTEKGCFQALLVDGSGSEKVVVAGVHICKPNIGSQGELYFYLNNSVVHSQNIDLSENNPYFGNGDSVKTSIIKKEGNTVTFNIAGIKQSFKSEVIEDMKATEITFIFGQYGSSLPLSNDGLFYAKFVKNNQSVWRNVPNKFSAGDVAKVDCRTGEITLNDAPAPEYGALGNDWENFCLTPGENKVVVVYSDWVFDEYAPTFKMKYREVFL